MLSAVRYICNATAPIKPVRPAPSAARPPSALSLPKPPGRQELESDRPDCAHPPTPSECLPPLCPSVHPSEPLPARADVFPIPVLAFRAQLLRPRAQSAPAHQTLQHICTHSSAQSGILCALSRSRKARVTDPRTAEGDCACRPTDLSTAHLGRYNVWDRAPCSPSWRLQIDRRGHK